MLRSYLSLSLPSYLSLSNLQTNILCMCLLSSPGANFQPFFFRLDSVLIIFGERLKLRSSSLCSFPHSLCQAQIFSLSPTSQTYR